MKVLFQYFKPLLFFIFGIGLLVVSLKGVNSREFYDTLKHIPLRWVFLSMALGYLAFIFRGLRWMLLIKPLGYTPKVSNLIHAIAFGYLFNSFIPRSGEVIRCTALNKVSDVPISKLFGHVLLERIIDFALLFTCLFLSFLLNYNHFLLFFEDVVFPTQIIIYLGLLFLLVVVGYKFFKHFLNSDQISKINNFIHGIKVGFMSIKKIEKPFLFLLYTLLIWACYLFMTVVCFYCFSETTSLTLNQGLFVMVAGGLGMVIPTPTGIGSYHYLVIKALVGFNIGLEIAQFFAIIVHSSQAIMIISMGLVGMFILYKEEIKFTHE